MDLKAWRSATRSLVRRDFRIFSEGLMNQTAIKRIHGGEYEGLAGAANLIGEFADTAEEVLLFLLAIAFHIDDDIGRAFFVAIQNAVEEILQILQGLTVPTYQAAGITGMDVEDVTARWFHFFHLKNEAEVAEHQFQGFTSALQ